MFSSCCVLGSVLVMIIYVIEIILRPALPIRLYWICLWTTEPYQPLSVCWIWCWWSICRLRLPHTSHYLKLGAVQNDIDDYAVTTISYSVATVVILSMFTVKKISLPPRSLTCFVLCRTARVSAWHTQLRSVGGPGLWCCWWLQHCWY